MTELINMTNYRNERFLDFHEARVFAHSLKLKNRSEWKVYCKSGEKPSYVPSTPDDVYKNKEWKGWRDWLGAGNLYFQKKKARSFEEARLFIQTLALKNVDEWRLYCKSGNKPDDIPAHPHLTYKNKDWKGYGDWLGVDNAQNRKKVFLPFEEARAFVQALNLGNSNEWKAYSKGGNRPANIPAHPNVIYKNKDWKGYGDWLGSGNLFKRKKIFLPFKEAKKFVQIQGIKRVADWRKYCESGEKPDNIPSNPNQVYKKKGWKGYGDFFWDHS